MSYNSLVVLGSEIKQAIKNDLIFQELDNHKEAKKELYIILESKMPELMDKILIERILGIKRCSRSQTVEGVYDEQVSGKYILNPNAYSLVISSIERPPPPVKNDAYRFNDETGICSRDEWVSVFSSYIKKRDITDSDIEKTVLLFLIMVRLSYTAIKKENHTNPKLTFNEEVHNQHLHRDKMLVQLLTSLKNLEHGHLRSYFEKIYK